MEIFAIAFTFFLVANPIGNSPAILALIQDFSFEKQKKIMLRESIIAFLIAVFFQYFGEIFLEMIHVEDYALSFTGGILLFLAALGMILPKTESESSKKAKQEPFFFPIAMPLISGPGLMTMIMIYSRQSPGHLTVFLSICLAWVGVTGVLVSSPYLLKILKKRGLAALEQLIGLVLCLLSTEMAIKGVVFFVKSLKGN